ncbi:MAG: CRISPR-associated protein Cas4 [Candidatus Riflebacteria bacterium]|nr:CRISPR-associated protein Cas4 [Candidatus Riflebacteria bacterium]
MNSEKIFKDEDCIQISGLQHFAFCKRRWGLIHIDQEWVENFLTAEGRNMHERVDEGYSEFRKGLRQYSGLYVKSCKLGVYGRTDLVEALKTEDLDQEIGLLGLKGHWELFPVEFKRGKPYSHEADSIQLCTQALCLEEMTGSEIREGAVFYGQIKRRVEVRFDSDLRTKTRELIVCAHDLLGKGIVPAPVFQKHCRSCSMIDICMPDKFFPQKVEQYRRELLG